MDFWDEILGILPREKFFQMLKHANANAVEMALERLLKEHIVMKELLKNSQKISKISAENSRIFDENLQKNSQILSKDSKDNSQKTSKNSRHKNDKNNAKNKNDLEKNLTPNLSIDEQISLFCVENEALIKERLNDYFIGLTAEILSAEG